CPTGVLPDRADTCEDHAAALTGRLDLGRDREVYPVEVRVQPRGAAPAVEVCRHPDSPQATRDVVWLDNGEALVWVDLRGRQTHGRECGGEDVEHFGRGRVHHVLRDVVLAGQPHLPGNRAVRTGDRDGVLDGSAGPELRLASATPGHAQHQNRDQRRPHGTSSFPARAASITSRTATASRGSTGTGAPARTAATSSS